jgi:anaerobic selenocysteine-containing dehydrogenase
MTDTAREADIILPAKSMFEQSDVINAYWHPYIQIKQKIMEPPAQVKPETEIYYLLAKKLGIPQEEINKHLPGLTDADINGYLTKRLAPFPELTLESLSKSPIIAPGHQEIAFSDYIFPTPSGKVELYSEEAQKRWGVSPLPEYTESVESVKQKLEQAIRYPLHLLTPNTKNRIHSQFNNLSMIRAISPKPILSLNIEDAKKRGIKNGDIVRIYNDRGALTIEAQIDFSIKSGCVSVTNGWWICDGGTVNFLSAGRETDIGYGAAFHDNLVEVEKTQ